MQSSRQARLPRPLRDALDPRPPRGEHGRFVVRTTVADCHRATPSPAQFLSRPDRQARSDRPHRGLASADSAALSEVQSTQPGSVQTQPRWFQIRWCRSTRTLRPGAPKGQRHRAPTRAAEVTTLASVRVVSNCRRDPSTIRDPAGAHLSTSIGALWCECSYLGKYGLFERSKRGSRYYSVTWLSAIAPLESSKKAVSPELFHTGGSGLHQKSSAGSLSKSS